MRHQAELLLVVAANPRRRGDLVGRLARAGWAVGEAASVTAALALAHIDPPGLIVLASGSRPPAAPNHGLPSGAADGGGVRHGQAPVGPQREGGALALRHPTPDPVALAAPDRIGGALADHRATRTDGFRLRLSSPPPRSELSVRGIEQRGVGVTAGGPQPPWPQRRRSHVPKGFLPRLHLSPRNDDHAGASVPRRSATPGSALALWRAEMGSYP
jgi:hypothetical protein